MVNPRKDLRSVKLGRLFAEAKKRGISQLELREVIAPAQIGKRLSKATSVEIEKLAMFIGAPGPRPLAPGPRRYEDLGRRDGFALPSQLRKIEAMWIDVSRMPDYTAKQKALKGFLKRIAGVEEMRFIEDWQVQKIIKAIEQMQHTKKEAF